MSIKLKLSISRINRLAFKYGTLGSLTLAAALTQAQESATLMEEIEVTGIRGSLRQALDTKRMSNSVVDAVSAEDIGKFPDKNIGDALQRMPGVTVERSFGEVSGITVRGTAPEHSIVLLNGQGVASTGWFDLGGVNRSFNFELLSAEQISGMELYKSSESNINEGAIGGTVDLHTRRPLDLDTWTVYASVEGGKNELADGWTPSASGLVSWKNAAETFGVLAGFSLEEQNIIRQELENIGIDANPGSNGDANIGPWGFGSRLFEEERERTSLQVSVQFSPTDTLGFNLDYFEFGTESDITNHNYLAIPSLNGIINDNTKVVNAKGATTYGEVTASNAANGLVPLFYNPLVRKPKIDTDVLNLSMSFQGNGWSSDVIAGQSTSRSRTEQVSTWWGAAGNANITSFSYDNAGPHKIIPNTVGYVTDPSLHSFHQEMTFEQVNRDQEIQYLQTDFSIETNMGSISSVDVGLKYQTNNFEASKDVMNPVLADVIAQGFTLADFNGGVVSGLHGETGRSGTLNTYITVDESIFGYSKSHRTNVVVTDPWEINEDSLAAYVKANFEGDGYRGNIGLRIVDTDVVSEGLVDDQPTKGTQQYTNFLPSANLVYDLADDLLLRFAAGSTIARPNYDQMKMNTSINVNFATATVGSPDLKPYTSDNYDMGLEWYFVESSVLGVTFFKKNISDYIEQTEAIEVLPGCSSTCRVTRYRNVGTADVSGIELQYQQELGNGFGLLTNYTYTDSEVDKVNGDTVEVQGVSQNSLNVSAYYENTYVSARIAYNYRDEWEGVGLSANVLNDPYDQWDASLVWHAMENIDLSLEAVNLLNETITSAHSDYDISMNSNEFGARYYLGVSMEF